MHIKNILHNNAQYNYYISNEVLLVECDKEENVPVTGGCYCFLFEKKTVKRSVQCHACAQFPKEDFKTFWPMSRIRPITKRRL